jgi:hypothetical protein
MYVVIVLAFLVLGLGGCQTARSVLPITLAPVELVTPIDARLLTTHEVAVRGIAAMVKGQFGLPLPPEVTVYVYGTRRGFEEGLVQDAKLSPGRAAELGEFAIGVGRPRKLLFRDDAADRGRDWLRLIAHELVHVSQIELAGGERGPEQWLKEGMAEWVAFGVLERLQIDSLAHRRRGAACSTRRRWPRPGSISRRSAPPRGSRPGTGATARCPRTSWPS